MEDSQVVLFADFDSANMARYERVIKSTLPSTTTTNQPSSQNLNNNTSNQSPNVNKTNLDNSTIGNQNDTQSNEKNNTQAANQAANKEQSQILPKFDLEFNVWTKPDCDGTPAVNSNRSFKLSFLSNLFYSYLIFFKITELGSISECAADTANG